MTSLLVPVAVVIISHDSNPIKVAVDGWHIIACRKGAFITPQTKSTFSNGWGKKIKMEVKKMVLNYKE